MAFLHHRRNAERHSAVWLWLVVVALALIQTGCATLPSGYTASPSRAVADTGGTRLGRWVADKVAQHPGQSGVHLLERGIDAYLARLALAGAAERSLDVQYYIWHNDTTGKFLADALIQAADRGVRVRLLLDDIGTAADDAALLMLDSHPNIEVRLFNPVVTRSARGFGMLAGFSRVNRRMHNKSFSADSQVAIVGGRNVGDEYFAASGEQEFADLDAVVIGPAVREVSDGFDLYWNSPAAIPITVLSSSRPTQAETEAVRDRLVEFAHSQLVTPYAEALQVSDLAQALREGTLAFSFGTVRVLYDDPSKVAADAGDSTVRLMPQLLPEFDALRSDLLLVSAYFVPGDEGVAALRRLRERGVRVRVVTNSLAATDVPAVHAGYAGYRRALLEAGIELYELKPNATPAGEKRPSRREATQDASSGIGGSSRASLHAKTMAFDRRALFVGSMNLDPRSVFTNTEIGIVVEDPRLAGEFVRQIDARLPEIAYRLVLRSPDPGADPVITWLGHEDGQDIRYTQEPRTSAWMRFKAWFYSLWPIEPLL